MLVAAAEKSAYKTIVYKGRRPQMTFGPLTWNKKEQGFKTP